VKKEVLDVLVVALLVAVLVAASLGAAYFTGTRQTVTMTVIQTNTSTITETAQVVFTPPWNDTEYLTSRYSCSGTPCFSSNLSLAYAFACAQQADTQSGCRVEVTIAPQVNYNLTIWYPASSRNSEPAWANCEYTVNVPFNVYGYTYAYCISVSQSSFIIAEQAGPYP